MAEAMNADRLNEIRDMETILADMEKRDADLLAALDAAEAEARLMKKERDGYMARAAQAEQERDEAAAAWGRECRRADAAEARLVELEADKTSSGKNGVSNTDHAERET